MPKKKKKIVKEAKHVETEDTSDAGAEAATGAVVESSTDESVVEELESAVETVSGVSDEPASDDDEGPQKDDEERPVKIKKAPTVRTSKKGVDPFDAFVMAAKERWPGSIEKASELPVDGTPIMSTGNFVIDRMTYGGLRRGRLYRFWGRPKSAKTGSALNCAEAFTSNHCAECFDHKSKCKCKGTFRYAKCLYIDVEGRVSDNRPWSEAHGIETSRLAFVSPKGGEQVVDIADAALRSDAGIGLIIVDSIAQMASQSEITKTAEKGQTIGRNAMLINSALRKWVCSLVSKDIDSRRKPTIILINQIRNKTGSYGCFHQDTPVMFADGSQHRIKDVVEQRLAGPVISWNGSQLVERNITAWHDNGELGDGQEWLTFRVAGTGGRRGAIGFTCTSKHTLVTDDGREVPADDVKIGDKLLSWHRVELSQLEHDVILGSLFGDGHLHATDGRDSAAYLVLANQEQPEYLAWKLNLIRSLGFKRRDSANGRTSYASSSSFELGLLRQKLYSQAGEEVDKKYRQIPGHLLASSSLLTLAVWYMDDGNYKESHKNASISVKRLGHHGGRMVAQVLSARYPVTYSEAQQAIVFSTETFRQLSKDIAGFIPPCMAYKLLPEHRALAGTEKLEPMITETGRRTIGAKVLGIHTSNKKMRARRKYDITIAENSFYIVGGDSTGVVVHNSPDTMPGGLGQDYASACDIKFTRRQRHYLVPDGKGGYADKVVKYGGTGFKPGEDDTADFIEVDAKVTESGICPPGRFGTFNYWQTSRHGRRIGDTDNPLWLWIYAKKYELLKKDGSGYVLSGEEAKTQKEMESTFLQSRDLQEKVWNDLINILSK